MTTKIQTLMLALFFTAMFMPAYTVKAEEPASPRQQLTQLVEQLQKSPADSALREKIIKLVQTMKPAPAVPTEAEKYEGRGQFAFKSAKSPADYLDAAKEYEKSIAAAPWIARYYSDLCTIYEKAEKYKEAKRNCELYLLSGPTGAEASDARKRIAGLEFAMEKVNSTAQAAHQVEIQKAWIKSLDGTTFVKRGTFDYGTAEWEIYISDGVATLTYNVVNYSSSVWQKRLANSGYSGGKFTLATGPIVIQHIPLSGQAMSRVAKMVNGASNRFVAAGDRLECEISADGLTSYCVGEISENTGWTFQRR